MSFDNEVRAVQYKIKAFPIINVILKEKNIASPFFVVHVELNSKNIFNWTKSIKLNGGREIKLSDFGNIKEAQMYSIDGISDVIFKRFIEPKSGADLKEKIIETLLTASDGDVILFCWDDKNINNIASSTQEISAFFL